MLNQNDFVSAMNSAIKQVIENEYERYKEKCLEDLKKQFEREKNNFVRNVLCSIDILVQNDSLPGQLNVQINVKKIIIFSGKVLSTVPLINYAIKR